MEGMSERLGGKNSDSTFNVYVHNTSKVQEQFYKLQEKALAIFDKILQTNMLLNKQFIERLIYLWSKFPKLF